MMPPRLRLVLHALGSERLAGTDRLGRDADLLADQLGGEEGDRDGDQQADSGEGAPAKGGGTSSRLYLRRQRGRPAREARSRPRAAAPERFSIMTLPPSPPRARGRSTGRARFRGSLLAGATAVEALEDRFLLARVEPGSAIEHLDPARGSEDRDLRAAWRVSDGVLDQRVEGAIEIRAGARQVPASPASHGSRAIPASSAAFSHRSRRPIGRLRRRRTPRPALALARATQDQQLVDDLREAIDLAGYPRRAQSRRGRPRELVTKLLELQADPGERRAQLMRGIGHEVLLASEQPAEAAGHLVERASEGTLLLAPLDGGGRPSDRRPRPAGRRPRAGQSAGTVSRAISAPGERRRAAGRRHRAAARRRIERAGGVRDGGVALRDPHGADRPAVRAGPARRSRGSRSGCGYGGSPGRSARGARRRSRAARRSWLRSRPGRRCRRSRGPCASTTSTRPRWPPLSAATRRCSVAAAGVLERARGRSRRPPRPGSWPGPRTSESTRFPRLTPSGHPEGDQGEQQHVRHRKRESEPEAYWEPS